MYLWNKYNIHTLFVVFDILMFGRLFYVLLPLVLFYKAIKFSILITNDIPLNSIPK